jgi:hypothetical protein
MQLYSYFHGYTLKSFFNHKSLLLNLILLIHKIIGYFSKNTKFV